MPSSPKTAPDHSPKADVKESETKPAAVVSVTPDVLPPEPDGKTGPRTRGRAASGRPEQTRARRSAGGRSVVKDVPEYAARDEADDESDEPSIDEIKTEIVGESGEDAMGDLDMEVLSPAKEEFEEEPGDIVDVESGGDGSPRYPDSYRPGDETLPAVAGSRLPTVKDSFQAYVQQVRRYPLLQPEEEHALAVRFRDYRDMEAGRKIVQAHLRLVVKIAMDFQRRWMQNVLDLVQEGNAGLLHALNKFDPDKGIKFSYYSSFWIKAYILKFIMDNFRMVKIGTTQVQRKLFFNLNRERQKLMAMGYNPDATMLSERLGVSKNDVLEMEQRLSNGDVSLNVPVGDESDAATRMDFLPALEVGVEDSIAGEEVSDMVREKLKTLLPKLSEKELYILQNRLYTDSPETLREIGERYNITRERVRQLEIRLLEKIRKHFAGDIQDFSEAWIQS
ncbi:MAG: RNA polymerase factor sigma-32 [Desulfovibrionaceae bacterium]|nr:RNA polymerase factor sigma-32 [Desulfovibrionaceae bacterium]